MSNLGVSTTVEQDHRHSNLIFLVVTRRRLAGVTLQTRQTELEATATGFTARGDLGGYQPGTLRLDWSQVRELHFAPPGAGEVGGLYVRVGAHCSRCIVPRLTEAQTAELLDALIARFPDMMHTVQTDRAFSLRPPATSLNLLPQRPTLQSFSLSHALQRATQSTTRREHESARRIHRGTARPL